MRTEFPSDLIDRLRRHVLALASAPRPPASREHAAARRYIDEHLKRAGIQVDSDSGVEPITGEPCINVLSRPIPGDPSLPLVIIGAHYDSTPGTPGADDNASAVAAMLEVAAWVRPLLDGSKRWATARLQFAAYDLEEYGMIGSARHADQVGPVRCMISLEMLGFTDRRPGGQKLPPHLAGMYPDVGDFIGVCGNEASRRWAELATQALKEVPGLPVESIVVPGRGEALPPVRLSDHSSFWDRDHAALMITDTSFFRNPHYHQPTDTPETLDYPFLAKVTRGVGGAVLKLLAAE